MVLQGINQILLKLCCITMVFSERVNTGAQVDAVGNTSTDLNLSSGGMHSEAVEKLRIWPVRVLGFFHLIMIMYNIYI